MTILKLLFNLSFLLGLCGMIWVYKRKYDLETKVGIWFLTQLAASAVLAIFLYSTSYLIVPMAAGIALANGVAMLIFLIDCFFPLR